MWTAPSARGLGVARRTLRRLEGSAREAGLTTLRLDTNKALTEAHALYRKEGYREVGRFNDNPYAHHWFEKRLGPWTRPVRSPGSARTDQVLVEGGDCGRILKARVQAVFITAPSITWPVVTYFHSATSSLRASVTISAFLTRPPLALTRSSNHSVKAEFGLMAPPQPGQFDEGCSQARIAGLGCALFSLDASAAPWRRREPGVSGDLTPIGEGPKQPFQPQHGRELGADAFEREQHLASAGA